MKSPVIIEQKEEDEATPAKKQKKQKKKKFVEPVPIPTGKVATYVPAQQTRASEEDWTFVDRWNLIALILNKLKYHFFLRDSSFSLRYLLKSGSGYTAL